MKQISIEVIKRGNSTMKAEKIIELCNSFLCSNVIKSGSIINEIEKPLSEQVECIIIGDFKEMNEIKIKEFLVHWYIYTLNSISPKPEFSEDDFETILYTHTVVPSVDFHGLWESLYYDTDIKEKLLSYASTMLTFAEKGVSQNLIYSNRVVLLHGPPGTGKTSVCKALAHKLAIRLKHKYPYSQLIEINSHNLFSKWFSESGKLVTKLFSYIYDLLEDEKMLVCVLVDEIETLTLARTSCLSGNDPSDSVRVVNAVLTQLDKMRKFPNVILLSTSNMTSGLDHALVDRADITQYIGVPTAVAIYEIYCSCVQELMRVGIIRPVENLIPASILKCSEKEEIRNCEFSKQLMNISMSSYGLSGRILRKIPVTAHSYFMNSEGSCSLSKFLVAMSSAVDFHKNQIDYFKHSPK